MNVDVDETVKFDRDDEFELMLTAIEENSGHMIILATIEWGKSLSFEYDNSKPVNSRLKLTRLKSHYNIRQSKFVL